MAPSQPLVGGVEGGEPDFDPSQDSVTVNYMRVMGHVVQKGFQLGAVVGCVVVVPVMLYRQGGLAAGVAPRLASALCRTVATATAVSAALGVARLSSLEDVKAGVEDRAYRLHYNKGQVRTDRFAQVGTALGGAAAVALLPASATTLVGGGAMGAAAGLLAHVATAPKKEE